MRSIRTKQTLHIMRALYEALMDEKNFPEEAVRIAAGHKFNWQDRIWAAPALCRT